MTDKRTTMIQDAKDSIDRLTSHIEKLMEITAQRQEVVPVILNPRTEAYYKQNKR